MASGDLIIVRKPSGEPIGAYEPERVADIISGRETVSPGVRELFERAASRGERLSGSSTPFSERTTETLSTGRALSQEELDRRFEESQKEQAKESERMIRGGQVPVSPGIAARLGMISERERQAADREKSFYYVDREGAKSAASLVGKYESPSYKPLPDERPLDIYLLAEQQRQAAGPEPTESQLRLGSAFGRFEESAFGKSFKFVRQKTSFLDIKPGDNQAIGALKRVGTMGREFTLGAVETPYVYGAVYGGALIKEGPRKFFQTVKAGIDPAKFKLESAKQQTVKLFRERPFEAVATVAGAAALIVGTGKLAGRLTATRSMGTITAVSGEAIVLPKGRVSAFTIGRTVSRATLGGFKPQSITLARTAVRAAPKEFEISSTQRTRSVGIGFTDTMSTKGAVTSGISLSKSLSFKGDSVSFQPSKTKLITASRTQLGVEQLLSKQAVFISRPGRVSFKGSMGEKITYPARIKTATFALFGRSQTLPKGKGMLGGKVSFIGFEKLKGFDSIGKTSMRTFTRQKTGGLKLEPVARQLAAVSAPPSLSRKTGPSLLGVPRIGGAGKAKEVAIAPPAEFLRTPRAARRQYALSSPRLSLRSNRAALSSAPTLGILSKRGQSLFSDIGRGFDQAVGLRPMRAQRQASGLRQRIAPRQRPLFRQIQSISLRAPRMAPARAAGAGGFAFKMPSFGFGKGAGKSKLSLDRLTKYVPSYGGTIGLERPLRRAPTGRLSGLGVRPLIMPRRRRR